MSAEKMIRATFDVETTRWLLRLLEGTTHDTDSDDALYAAAARLALLQALRTDRTVPDWRQQLTQTPSGGLVSVGGHEHEHALLPHDLRLHLVVKHNVAQTAAAVQTDEYLTQLHDYAHSLESS